VTQMAVPVSPSPATSQDNTALGAARTEVSGPSQARPEPTSHPSVNRWDERYEIRSGTGLYGRLRKEL
jgi:hypothetical protein